jgi:hypothetical protein
MDPNEQDEDRDEDLKPRDASHTADAEQPSNSEPAGDHGKEGLAKASSAPRADICQTPQKHSLNELQKETPPGKSIPITAPALSKIREGLEDPAEASNRILTPSTSKLLEEAEDLPKEPSATAKKAISDPSALGTVARQFLALLKVCFMFCWCLRVVKSRSAYGPYVSNYVRLSLAIHILSLLLMEL